jgi:carbonic anhydrase
MIPKHMTVAAACGIVAALAFTASAPAQESVQWSYEGSTGPEHWASLSPAFRACGEGSRQSPIDLRAPVRRAAEPIRITYTPGAVSLHNNGETVEVRSDLAQTLRVGTKSFSLVQLHFHSPSEHLVAGVRSPLEVHFVHQAADGERAVLGTLVRIGHKNMQLERLLESLPHDPEHDARVQAPVDLRQLLPAATRAYRYSGSLTTPPCTEGIRWLVLATPIQISAHQLTKLRATVEGNARPVQPRNGRPLILS